MFRWGPMEHTSSFALKSPFLSSFRGTSALLRMDDLIERCLKVLPAHESLVIVLLRKAILRGHRLQCAGNPDVKTLVDYFGATPKKDVICYQHWYLPNDQNIYYSE